MYIKFWGARGSVPVSGNQYLKYGGDTPCLEIRSKNNKIIIVDAGTGIRQLGSNLINEGIFDYIFLFTHSHWDHIIGFPFFKPIYMKKSVIKIIQYPKYQGSYDRLLSNVMHQPHFPIQFDTLNAKFNFLNNNSSNFYIDTISVDIIPLSHPNIGVGYRFEEDGKTFVFLTDNELTYRHRGGMDFDNYVRFAQGVDLLVHDAEYTEEDYVKTKAWGHSVYKDALNLAIQANVKSFGLYHHNQDRTDEQIDEMVNDCRRILASNEHKIECFAVSQDMEVVL